MRVYSPGSFFSGGGGSGAASTNEGGGEATGSRGGTSVTDGGGATGAGVIGGGAAGGGAGGVGRTACGITVGVLELTAFTGGAGGAGGTTGGATGGALAAGLAITGAWMITVCASSGESFSLRGTAATTRGAVIGGEPARALFSSSHSEKKVIPWMNSVTTANPDGSSATSMTCRASAAGSLLIWSRTCATLRGSLVSAMWTMTARPVLCSRAAFEWNRLFDDVDLRMR
jgi:hypothetical protein